MKFLPAILAISLLAAKAKASGETETTAGNQDTMAMMSDTMPLSLDAGTINVVTEASQLRGDGVKKHLISVASHLRGNVDVESFAQLSLMLQSRCDGLAHCNLVEGTYDASEGGQRPWWAFVPDNCPDGGCPLFFWIDGTGEVDFRHDRQQLWMEEMFNRGFVAVTADYASGIVSYGGCYGRGITGSWGVDDKAKSIFDQDHSNSIPNQVCGEHANCDLGIAVGGFSQGSQIVALAGDYDERVSAALLYGCGNFPNNGLLVGIRDMQCMNTVKLAKQRRRYFSGDNDGLFGLTYDGDHGTRSQMVEMSHYNCDTNGGAGDDNCLQHPESNANSPDPYTGGMIENIGGYYIVKGGVHGQFLDWANFTNPDLALPYYKSTHLDWLAATAKSTKPPLDEDERRVTLQMDLDHRWKFRETAPQGIFFEWAAAVNSRGVLGRRWIVAEGTTSARKTFSQVPTDVVGFRLTARTINAAFLDQVHVKEGRRVFENLSFGDNNNRGFCFSRNPSRDWSDCEGNISRTCIDFCTNGRWYDCGNGDANHEFSRCPVPI
mmetsp:Transcript_9784/g.17660  ORF Transcript_9784/g.17660 Transcript_9784/m.17660 type:complete len:548 (-) Transcript_9784:307-1950(-)